MNPSVMHQFDRRALDHRRRQRRPLLGAILLALLLMLGASCSSGAHHASGAKATTPTTQPKTVLAAIGDDPELTTFLTALRLGTPTGTMDGAGPYTVLVPTNRAFAKLAPSTIDGSSPAGRQKLVQVIDGHILAGATAGHPLTLGRVTTSSGSTITVARSGSTLMVTDGQGHTAKVIRTLPSGNGWVYVIDGVLLPA